MEAGAAGVTAYVTHGVLSGGAVARVEGSALTELVVTDSIATRGRGQGRRQDPPHHHRAAARRSHAAHQRGKLGQLAIRLIGGTRPQQSCLVSIPVTEP